jgi:transcriptional regulator with XRE-family HTH domain
MAEKIGKLLHLLRTAEGLSQDALAEELGVSRVHLSQIENGHKEPSLAVLRKAADFFQVPLPVLLANESDPESEIMVQLKRMLGEVLLLRISGIERRKKNRRKRRATEKKA